MKNTKILSGETCNRAIKRFLAVNSVKGILAAAAGALLTIGVMPSAKAQAVYSVNIVGFRDVADRTVQLLTQPMTTKQRQARHAKNFMELAPSQRTVYLHTVALATSHAIASANYSLPLDNPAMLTSDALVAHLQAVPSIYDAPTVPSEYSQLVAAHLAIVNVALQELNALISGIDPCLFQPGPRDLSVAPIANNSSLQQAMYAGAVHGSYMSDYSIDY